MSLCVFLPWLAWLFLWCHRDKQTSVEMCPQRQWLLSVSFLKIKLGANNKLDFLKNRPFGHKRTLGEPLVLFLSWIVRPHRHRLTLSSHGHLICLTCHPSRREGVWINQPFSISLASSVFESSPILPSPFLRPSAESQLWLLKYWKPISIGKTSIETRVILLQLESTEVQSSSVPGTTWASLRSTPPTEQDIVTTPQKLLESARKDHTLHTTKRDKKKYKESARGI